MAQIFSGSMLAVEFVLIETSFAASFHGAIWCHTASSTQNTLCDFQRVAFIKNYANENGAVGGWGSFLFDNVEFRDNWALRGAAVFLNRAKEAQPRRCSTSADCRRLEICAKGQCEISITIHNSSFVTNIAQGDFGGGACAGTSGFTVSLSITGAYGYSDTKLAHT